MKLVLLRGQSIAARLDHWLSLDNFVYWYGKRILAACFIHRNYLKTQSRRGAGIRNILFVISNFHNGF